MVAPKAIAPQVSRDEVAMILRELIEHHLVALGSQGAAVAWWDAEAGRFQDDPVFDEMIRLGHKARQADRPKPKAKRARS